MSAGGMYEVSTLDKYEYKLRLEEIKTLNRKGRFQEAAQVADTVDWKKVRNVSTLGIISDVYKVNRRFEDAKEILLLAKEQSPQNRRILYSLCDLTVKMGQVVEAVEYYKEYVQMAPNDSSKYILLYKIYEAQDISLDERIAVLKEYKKREYNEKWAYELASLYHRCGYATECVEECDQLILWFGEGKYVAKAMELKRRYVPLSPAQQQAYDRMFGRRPEQEEEQPAVKAEHQTVPEPAEEEAPQEEELEIQVKPMDMGQYNTMNLQAALAESMKEVMEQNSAQPADYDRQNAQYEEPEHVPSADRAVEETPLQQSAYGGDNAEYQEDLNKVMQDSAAWDVQATGQLEPVEHAPHQNETPVPQTGTATPQSKTELPKQGRVVAFAQPVTEEAGMQQAEEKPVERQITGQMNIEDVLAEWEKLKKKNEEKRRQETRQWMLQQTGSLFDEFDQLSRDGVLEKLQREESLPIEPVGNRRKAEISELPEVEELEEVEDAGEILREAPVRQISPKPANATARAVLAAQGVMDEIPAAKGQGAAGQDMQKVTAPENVPEAGAQQAAGSPEQGMPLSETEQKRLALEALMREAEEKQRQAQALWMQLEKERQAMLAQQTAWQQAMGQTAVAAQGQQAQPVPEQSRQAIQNADGAQPDMQMLQQQSAPSGMPPLPQQQGVQTGMPQALQQQNAQTGMPQAPQQQGARSGVQAEAGNQNVGQYSAGQAGAQQQNTEEQNAPQDAAGDGAVTGNTAALQERIKEQQLEEHERNMTQDERDLFAPFVPTRGAMRQLVKALDAISLSAFTGNMVVTGAPGSDMMKLAKSVIKIMRVRDRNFSGKLAKISGDILNTRNAVDIVTKIPNGALIIEKGGKLSDEGAANLVKALNQEQTGIIVFLLDTKRAIARLMERSPQLAACFTARFDIAALDTGTLVKYGCQYAYNMEYSIDELGRLALHTRIEDMQTRDHAVTVEEVREIIDEAIEHAERFSIRHFLDVLFRRRYDEDDMIILRERDFI